jgi:anti-sigma B factor antagonist
MQVPLELRTEQGPNGLAVLTVSGDLDLVAAPRLRAAIRERLDPPPAALLIDLTAVSFLDSSGLDELVDARRVSAADGIGLFLLTAGNRAVLRPLEVTGLAQLFAMAPSREAVAARLGGPR